MSSKAHSYYLEELIMRLDKINEPVKGIRWLVQEPRFYVRSGCNQKPMCDILIGYIDNSARPIELKGSRVKRDKAISQLNSGVLLLNEWGYDIIRPGKIVYYSRGQYEYELYKWKR